MFLCLCLLGSPVTALAMQESATPAATPQPELPTFVFRPIDHDENGYFAISLKPGESTTVKVLVGNGGKSPLDVRTYAADAFSMQNGGFGLLDSKSEKSGVTTWIDFPTKELSLKPGEGVEQSFTVTVPEGTEPGQYISGIAMEIAEPISTGSDGGLLQFEQVLRSARAVFITVPGALTPSFEIGDASYNQEGAANSIVVGIRNTGNVFVKPAGTVEVRDAAGAVILSAPVVMGSVYAGDETTIAIGLTQGLSPGDFQMSLDLSDEKSGVSASRNDLTFTVLASATPTALEPIVISSVTATAQPSLEDVQFLTVDTTIRNNGDEVKDVSVILHAYLDGALVEDFPIASSVALASGDTTFQSRYLPLSGWTSGTWTFTLTVEVVSPETGASLLLATSEIEGSIVVP